MNDKQTEYERRRRVWRYLTGMEGPKEEPQDGDRDWLGSEWEERA